MLRRWVHEAAPGGGASKIAATSAAPTLASFVQLPMMEPRALPKACPVQPTTPAAAAQQPTDITVEIHRGGTAVHAKLTLDSRSAAWLREVLG